MKNSEEKSSGKTLASQFSLRDVRNAVFGLITVFGGLVLAVVTLWAHQTGNPQLAGGAAVASLVFVVLILLFVIPPLARNASKEVSQFDLPLELTTGGLIFLGIVVIVGFAAWNTGNNLLFLVLAFLLATLFVSLVLGSSNLKKLEAKMRFPEAIFVGEPTYFFVSLNNKKWILPSFSVLMTLRGALTDDPFGGRQFKLIKPPKSFAKFLRLPYIKRHVGYFLHVSRRSEAEQQTEQTFAQRGRFIIKDFELTTRFPFGFWLQRKRLTVKETEVFVFPKLSDVREFLPTNTRQIGQFTSNRRGAGQDLLTLRDYQTADDVRRVDWKATARTGNLIVRDYTAEDERKITILFDTNLPKIETPNPKNAAKIQEERQQRFERGASLAASLIAHFINENAQIRLIINEETGNFGEGKPHLYKCLRRLSIAESRENNFDAIENISNADNDFRFVITTNENSPQDSAAPNVQFVLF